MGRVYACGVTISSVDEDHASSGRSRGTRRKQRIVGSVDSADPAEVPEAILYREEGHSQGKVVITV